MLELREGVQRSWGLKLQRNLLHLHRISLYYCSAAKKTCVKSTGPAGMGLLLLLPLLELGHRLRLIGRWHLPKPIHELLYGFATSKSRRIRMSAT
jgi:hypothetical protein